MADTTARALLLLELLQSAQQRNVTELADRLGVDERTVRRDVARLVELGLPVEALRGRYGGYRLAPRARHANRGSPRRPLWPRSSEHCRPLMPKGSTPCSE